MLFASLFDAWVGDLQRARIQQLERHNTALELLVHKTATQCPHDAARYMLHQSKTNQQRLQSFCPDPIHIRQDMQAKLAAVDTETEHLEIILKCENICGCLRYHLFKNHFFKHPS